ncbi:unnamed protein product, partial [Meganyctiphanes norvegica]
IISRGYSALPEVGSHLVTMITSLLKSILQWVKEGKTLNRIYQWTSREETIHSSVVSYSLTQPLTFLQSCTSDLNLGRVSNWEIDFYISEWKMMLEKDCLLYLEKFYPFLAIQISDLLYYLEQTNPTLFSSY